MKGRAGVAAGWQGELLAVTERCPNGGAGGDEHCPDLSKEQKAQRGKEMDESKCGVQGRYCY